MELSGLDLPLWAMLVALVVTAVAAALQASIGFGFGIIAVPILALIDSDLAPVPQLLLGLPLVSAMAWRERNDVDLRGLGWLFIGKLAGGVAGLALLKALSDASLDAAMGIAVLLLTILVASGWTPRLSKGSQFGGGALSGVTGVIASIGGPPLALLYRAKPAATMRSTLAVVFLVSTLLTIALRMAGSEITALDFWLALAMLPALIVGLVIGVRLIPRLNAGIVRAGVLVVSIAAAGLLILRAVTSAGQV